MSGNIIVLNRREEPVQDERKEVLNLAPSTLSVLERESRKIEDNSRDFLVDRGSLNINTDLDLYAPNMGCLPMSQFAMSQLCNKLGVPSRYINKCIETGRLDLAHDNLSSWLEDYPSSTFIREYNGRIRGVLTSKYSVCDTPEIIRVVDDVLDTNNYKIKGFFLNEERFHLRLVNKSPLPIVGEDLFSGITIDSSDVGRSPLTVNFLVYKQVCTNGLVVTRGKGTLFHQKHIGITADEFHEDLGESLNIVASVEEEVVNRIMLTRERALHWDINSSHPEEVQELINYVRQQTKLSEEHSKKVIHLMKNTYDDSRWGMINAITEVAQEFSLERRIELEKIAGSLLVA